MPAPLKIAFALVLIAFPLLEVALLLRASSILGAGTIALVVILTGIAGVAIVQRQGLQTISRTLSALQAGRGGLEPMFDGLLRVTAGILLILPGLVTDVLGLALLIPQIRQLVVKAGLAKFLAGGLAGTEIFGGRFESRGGSPGHEPDEAIVIEGEYERVEDPPRDSKPLTRPHRA